jgi:hypothetical protein
MHIIQPLPCQCKPLYIAQHTSSPLGPLGPLKNNAIGYPPLLHGRKTAGTADIVQTDEFVVRTPSDNQGLVSSPHASKDALRKHNEVSRCTEMQTSSNLEFPHSTVLLDLKFTEPGKLCLCFNVEPCICRLLNRTITGFCVGGGSAAVAIEPHGTVSPRPYP